LVGERGDKRADHPPLDLSARPKRKGESCGMKKNLSTDSKQGRSWEGEKGALILKQRGRPICPKKTGDPS